MRTRTNAFMADTRSKVLLANTFEKNYLQGRLDVIQEVMEKLESDDVFNVEVALGELHLMHMEATNEMCEKFGEGEPINCVEFYTDKYLAQPTLESPTLLQ